MHLEWAWRIEFSYKDIREYWEWLDEFGQQLPELTLLTAPNILEYLYKKVQFSARLAATTSTQYRGTLAATTDRRNSGQAFDNYTNTREG